jgi:hypothetical protein
MDIRNQGIENNIEGGVIILSLPEPGSIGEEACGSDGGEGSV